MPTYLNILRRVGFVLLFEGLIATVVAIYLFAGGTVSVLSIDFSPLAVGFLLLRGDLAAAPWVRTISFSSLAAFPCLIVACCFLQPMDLTRVEILLNPALSAVAAVMLIFTVVALFWQIKELGRDQVQTAMQEVGVEQHSKANAIASGIALVVFACIFIGIVRGDKAPGIAVALAEQQLGPGFRYYLGSLSKTARGGEILVSGIVTAWNDNEIRTIPLDWEERQ